MWVVGERRRSMDNQGKGTRLWVSLLLVATITCFACAPIKKQVSRIIRPEVCWESIRTIAVLRFDGPYGEMLWRHVYSRLAEVQHFNPRDTTRLRALAKRSYDKVEDTELWDAIEDLEADAVMTGHVTADLHDMHGTDQVQVKEGTGHYKKEKNVYGQWVDVEIKRTVVRPVPYVVRQASVDMEYNVFDLKTRRAMATGMIKETYNEKFGGDKEYGSPGHKLSDLLTQNGTLDELAAGLATKLVAKLSRMKLARMIKLDEGGNSMVKQGAKLAKGGVWEEAIEIWEQVIHDEPDNAAAYYNLGVAHETLGDMKSLRMARDLYKKAASHGDKNLYTEAMARIQRAMSKSHSD